MIFDTLFKKAHDSSKMTVIEKGLAQFFLEKIIKRIHDEGYQGLTPDELDFTILLSEQEMGNKNNIFTQAFMTVTNSLATRNADGTNPHHPPSADWRKFRTQETGENLLKHFKKGKEYAQAQSANTNASPDKLTIEYIFNKLINNDLEKLTTHELTFIEALVENSTNNPLISQLTAVINQKFDLAFFIYNDVDLGENTNNPRKIKSTFSSIPGIPYFFDALFHPILKAGNNNQIQKLDHYLFFEALVIIAKKIQNASKKSRQIYFNIDFDELEKIYGLNERKFPQSLKVTYRKVYHALFSEEQQNNIVAHSIIEKLASYELGRTNFEAARMQHLEIEKGIQAALANIRIMAGKLRKELSAILAANESKTSTHEIENKMLLSLDIVAFWYELFIYEKERAHEFSLKVPQRMQENIGVILKNANDVVAKFKDYSDATIAKTKGLKKIATEVTQFLIKAVNSPDLKIQEKKGEFFKNVTTSFDIIEGELKKLISALPSQEPNATIIGIKNKLQHLSSEYNADRIMALASSASVDETFLYFKKKLKIDSTFYFSEPTNYPSVTYDEIFNMLNAKFSEQMEKHLKEFNQAIAAISIPAIDDRPNRDENQQLPGSDSNVGATDDMTISLNRLPPNDQNKEEQEGQQVDDAEAIADNVVRRAKAKAAAIIDEINKYKEMRKPHSFILDDQKDSLAQKLQTLINQIECQIPDPSLFQFFEAAAMQIKNTIITTFIETSQKLPDASLIIDETASKALSQNSIEPDKVKQRIEEAISTRIQQLESIEMELFEAGRKMIMDLHQEVLMQQSKLISSSNTSKSNAQTHFNDRDPSTQLHRETNNRPDDADDIPKTPRNLKPTPSAGLFNLADTNAQQEDEFNYSVQELMKGHEWGAHTEGNRPSATVPIKSSGNENAATTATITNSSIGPITKEMVLQSLWGSDKNSSAPEKGSACEKVCATWKKNDTTPNFEKPKENDIEINSDGTDVSIKLACHFDENKKAIIDLTCVVDSNHHTETWTCKSSHELLDIQMGYELIAAESLALRIAQGINNPDVVAIDDIHDNSETHKPESLYASDQSKKLTEREEMMIKAHLNAGYKKLYYQGCYFELTASTGLASVIKQGADEEIPHPKNSTSSKPMP